MKSLQNRVLLILTAAAVVVTSSAKAADNAESLYKSKCAGCHAADGSGSKMGKKLEVRDFSSPEVQKESDAELSQIISKGRKKMPAYGSLKPEEVKDLVAYIRTFAKK